MAITRDTIFALSSGRPPAAIAVVRLSGPRAGEALKTLIGRIPPPREAALARVRDPQSGEAIDQALALWFSGPASETGEDTAELQLHGGRAVIAAVLAALGKIEGLRPAEAGEFTRRAFENGKLDLTAVEGLADLVMAETEAQRRQAFRQLTGALGDRAETWRARLIEALAQVEARIDFSDEADVPEDLISPALGSVRELAGEIETALADHGRGERLREGLMVAIAGPPNAGKSTLLNRIARREAAIVSPYAGTTRDVIEVHLDLDGWPVTLLDTAGVRASDDPVEQEGVRRAQARAAEADVVLWLTEFGGQDQPPPAVRDGQSIWRVHTKVDLPKGRNESNEQKQLSNEFRFRSIEDHKNIVNIGLKQWNELDFTRNENEFTISAVTGIGVERLMQAISAKAAAILGGREPALVTRERHRSALQETLARLRAALSDSTAGRDDLIAEELRLAARTLGRLTGRVDVEDILDVIFRDFCIGK